MFSCEFTTAPYYAVVVIYRTTASHYTTSHCIAVPIVVKGELANENVNYDTKLKYMYQLKPEVDAIKKGQSW